MRQPSTVSLDLRVLLTGPPLCAECVTRLCSAVRLERGVVSSTCDADAGTIEVVYDEALLTEHALVERLGALARDAEYGARHAAYRLTGLD